MFFSFFWLNTYGQCSHAHKKSFSDSRLSPGFNHLELQYDVKHYFIDLQVNDSTTDIAGNTQVYVEVIGDLDSLVFELNQNLTVDSVFFSGLKTDSFFHLNNLIYILPGRNINPGERLSATIFYRGKGSDTGFFSGLSNKSDTYYKTPVTYTLSEPFQASTWFPVKQDLHDKADSVRIHITVDSSLMAGSNGLLQKIVRLDNGMHRFEWYSDYPIAYYLISLAVSDYTDYSFYEKMEGSSDSILIQNYIYDHPEILSREKILIDRTGDLISLFSDLVGMYPFHKEKYGHSMAPMGGGMEHQTMTTLQNFNFELVAHELAHQWFGDYVSCASWQDIWINEGFASYFEYLALEYLEDKNAAIDWMTEAHNYALRNDSGSVYIDASESKDISRIFSRNLSYKKGAAILHMLRYEMDDDELYFEILKTFLNRYRNGVASGQDFLSVVNEVSENDYTWFFDQWYYGKGYPVYQASWKQRGDSLQIIANMKGTHMETLQFKSHIEFEIIFKDGSDTLIKYFHDEEDEFVSLKLKKEFDIIRVNPYSNVLMKSVIYEYFPEINPEYPGKKFVVEISPNPFKDKLYLSFLNYLTEKRIRVSSMEGNILFDKTFDACRNMTLDLGFLNQGVYLIIVEDDENRQAKKILKI